MPETDPFDDACRRFEDTDPHGLQDRNDAISTPERAMGQQGVDVLWKSPQLRTLGLFAPVSARCASTINDGRPLIAFSPDVVTSPARVLNGQRLARDDAFLPDEADSPAGDTAGVRHC